jgi:hypothetical protein
MVVFEASWGTVLSQAVLDDDEVGYEQPGAES